MLYFAKRSHVQISGVTFPEVCRRVGQRVGHLLTIWITVGTCRVQRWQQQVELAGCPGVTWDGCVALRNQFKQIIFKTSIHKIYFSCNLWVSCKLSFSKGPTSLEQIALTIFFIERECIGYIYCQYTLAVWRVISDTLPLRKTSQELRMLSRSLSYCKSLTLKVMIQVSQFVSNSNCVTKSLNH